MEFKTMSRLLTSSPMMGRMVSENMLYYKIRNPGRLCLRFLRPACSQPLWVVSFGRTQMRHRIEVKRGDKYGRLTVVDEIEPIKSPTNGRSYRRIQCRCDCGNILTANLGTVRRGDTASCGCLQRERARTTGRRNKTRGLSHSATYRAWAMMKSR